jgi:Zn-dependent M28 family amino/carboxypeptidase
MAGMSLAITILAFSPGRPDLLPLAMIAAVPNILLQFNFTNNASDGALDNAAGIGILLELARQWQGSAKGNKRDDIMFVATGAEELGLLGAIRFINKYAPSYDLGNTYFINLDGPGAKGRIIYVTGFGIPPVRTCNKLRVLTGEIVREKLSAGSLTLFVGAALDIIPVAARGFEAISISSGALSKPFLAVHSKNDRIEMLTLTHWAVAASWHSR